MKKVTLGIFVFSVIALLGIGAVAAFPGFGKNMMKQDLSEEEQEEMQAFHDSLQEAIENEDFEAWKSLMESQITEENFNKVIEMQEQQEERRAEMEEEREQFCEENDCPEGEFPEFNGMMHEGFGKMHGECPFAESSE
jgi:hypothetical protein